MQLNVERGAPMTGKTIRLRELAKANGQTEKQILVGRTSTKAALLRDVRRLASRGATVICIDECTEMQIRELERFKGKLPTNLTIHAVVAN
ncbi:hypothetical protein RTH74_11650 [Pseudomonas sp. zfem001]|uniref:hypothetical protein n=1 Tax=Pseudomonas sp. zfem001 TaxID=3078196 RepID=UPI00160D6CEC|nr:hypothetical protein [Pseudomonas sp. zfem001]MDU9408253.1 hypothetical protein [Pseudomonas sp. zfem001]